MAQRYIPDIVHGDKRILMVDGEPVLSGTVEGRSGDWLLLRTPAGELVYLGGATSQLRPGQKVRPLETPQS